MQLPPKGMSSPYDPNNSVENICHLYGGYTASEGLKYFGDKGVRGRGAARGFRDDFSR